MATEQDIGLRERGKLRRAAQIIDAACDVLREEGEAALTVERVAKRAELSERTVFNLIGTREQIWAEIGQKTLGDIDLERVRRVKDPQARARAMMDATVAMVCEDPEVQRALIFHWRHTARLVQHDPTAEFLGCLREAAAGGEISRDRELAHLARHISTGLIGLTHQWAAGLIGDRALRDRARDLVDVVFLAARSVPQASR